MRPDIASNVLEAIGDTPLVRLNKVTAGLDASLLAKLESANPGRSVKDRIGLHMIEEAERKGILKPGGTIVEPTSGNTGVAFAMVAAVKGYKCVFTIPDKMSQEKIRRLRAFGATVVVTPTAVHPDSPESYYSVAKRIAEETPGAVYLMQYHNLTNTEAHYRWTGPEIWRQTGGKITHFVAGMGTGGTISGVAKYLKEQNPDVTVVGIDPAGSILAKVVGGQAWTQEEAVPYLTEGTGEDFVPANLLTEYIDEAVTVTDKEAFLMGRRLAREEGIFCGGSSGASVHGAIKYAREKRLGKDAMVVIIMPDAGEIYLSKMYSDEWMKEKGFL